MATTSGVTRPDAACWNLQTRFVPRFGEVSEDEHSSVPGRWSRRPCLRGRVGAVSVRTSRRWPRCCRSVMAWIAWVVMSLGGAVRSRRASRADLATERMRNTRADRLWRRDRYVDAAASCSTSRGSLPEQTQRSCVTSIRLRMPNAGAIRASSRLTERDCRRRTTTRTAAFRLERITPTNSLGSSLRQRWWSGPETCESWRTKGPPS